MKKFLLLFFTFIIYQQVSGQVLLPITLNLNTGGVIYDATETQNHFILVGKFNTINGIPVNNIAFINKSDLSVNTAISNCIDSINGEIRTIAYKTGCTSTPPFYCYEHIYIGGNFTRINGTSRNGIAKLSYSSDIIPPSDYYSLNGFNPQIEFIDPTLSYGVNDILIDGNNVIFAGKFNFSSGAYSHIENIIAFNIENNSWNSSLFNNFASGSHNYNFEPGQSIVFEIKKYGNNYFICGIRTNTSNGLFFNKYNSSGSTNLSPSEFNVYNSGLQNWAIWDFEFLNHQADSIIIFTRKYAALTQNYSANLDGSQYNLSNVALPLTTIPSLQDLTSYNNKLYGYSNDNQRLAIFDLKNNSPISPLEFTTNTGIINSTTSISSGYASGSLGYDFTHITGNMLFLSGHNLTNVAGQSRTGLALFCLEPENPKQFTGSPITEVCYGKSFNYMVANCKNADAYEWSYTGTGVNIENDGLLHVDNFNNNITLNIESDFTPGELRVRPIADCMGNPQYADYLSISLSLSLTDIPHVLIDSDNAINCFKDSLILVGTSTDPDIINMIWYNDENGLPVINDTLIYKIIDLNYEKVFEVTNSIGCKNWDTLTVVFDTISPILTLPPAPYHLTCDEPIISIIGTSNVVNDSIFWTSNVDTSSTRFTNPLNTDLINNYYCHVQNLDNGCMTYGIAPISENKNIPNIIIPTHTIVPGQNLDTLNCNQTSLFLSLTSDSLNANLWWGETITPDITITTAGVYKIFAENTSNGCIDSLLQISIFEDFSSPIITLNGSPDINCSVDSTLLVVSGFPTDADFQWLSNGNDSIYANSTGYYLYQVQDILNGCITLDSVNVSLSNQILINLPEDTLVCHKSLVALTANYIGDLTGVNYSWNNGAITSNSTFNTDVLNFAILEINADGGCYGRDTVFFHHPTPPTIEVQAFRPCGNNATGALVITPDGGLPPYTFSLNNSIFQTSQEFNGLNLGNYTVYVRDSISCTYQTSAVIDDNSELPNPEFLMPTYNFIGDTVVLVNITLPEPDTIIWNFPSNIIVIDNSHQSPMISSFIADIYPIEMTVFYGTCELNLTKDLYIYEEDTTLANFNNQNGIKAVTLFPNPNTGAFTVQIEFYKKQNAHFAIYDMNSYVYHQEYHPETDMIESYIEMNSIEVINGTYVLKVVSEFDSAYLTFLIAR